MADSTAAEAANRAGFTFDSTGRFNMVSLVSECWLSRHIFNPYVCT